MPHRALRSRSLRRTPVRTPAGRRLIRTERRRPAAAHCSCGAILAGVPRVRDAEMAGLPRSSRRPNRPFAGSCPTCAREAIKERVRGGAYV